MAFPSYSAKTPTELYYFKITLSKGKDVQGDTGYSATYELELLDQNGETIHFPGQKGNLVPHLTGPEQASLMALLEDLVDRAETALGITANPL